MKNVFFPGDADEFAREDIVQWIRHMYLFFLRNYANEYGIGRKQKTKKIIIMVEFWPLGLVHFDNRSSAYRSALLKVGLPKEPTILETSIGTIINIGII